MPSPFSLTHSIHAPVAWVDGIERHALLGNLVRALDVGAVDLRLHQIPADVSLGVLDAHSVVNQVWWLGSRRLLSGIELVGVCGSQASV